MATLPDLVDAADRYNEANQMLKIVSPDKQGKLQELVDDIKEMYPELFTGMFSPPPDAYEYSLGELHDIIRGKKVGGLPIGEWLMDQLNLLKQQKVDSLTPKRSRGQTKSNGNRATWQEEQLAEAAKRALRQVDMLRDSIVDHINSEFNRFEKQFRKRIERVANIDDQD